MSHSSFCIHNHKFFPGCLCLCGLLRSSVPVELRPILTLYDLILINCIWLNKKTTLSLNKLQSGSSEIFSGQGLCECILSVSVVSDFLWPHDCSPPGFSVQGILQARILEWLVISSSRGSSQPRDGTCICPPFSGWFCITEPPPWPQSCLRPAQSRLRK